MIIIGEADVFVKELGSHEDVAEAFYKLKIFAGG